MKTNRPGPTASMPSPTHRTSSPPPRRLRTPRLVPIALAAAAVVVLLLVLFLPGAGPNGQPTGTPGPSGSALSGTPGATGAPSLEPTWSVTRPTTDLPEDAALVFTADGRPLLSFVESSGDAAGQRVWYAYDPAARLLRRAPVVWATVPFVGRTVRVGLFGESGRTCALAYGDGETLRLFEAADGSLFYTDIYDGVYRFDPAPLVASGGAATVTMLTPDRTADGFVRDTLLDFERSDGWSLTWANRPRLSGDLRFLAYATDRRGFLEDSDVHPDVRQVRLSDGADVVVAKDARPVGFSGGVLVYEKKDRKLYLRDASGADGPAGSAEVRWTGLLDQYELFGKWLVYTRTDGGTKHYFSACPATAAGTTPLRSISCSAKGRIANLYRIAPDGDTLGLIWLTDRATVGSARLVTLSLDTGTTRVYDLKTALAADGAVDSFGFEGWVSDHAVLVAVVRDGQTPKMRIVDLEDLTPLAATVDLTVQTEAAG